MFEHTDLFYEKLEWNCQLDAMWCDDESEDEDDDEE